MNSKKKTGTSVPKNARAVLVSAQILYLVRDELRSENRSVISRIDQLDAKFTVWIEELDYKFTAQDERLSARTDKLDARMDKLDARIAKLEGRMDRIEGKIDEVERGLSAKIDELDQRLSARIGALEKRMDERFEQLETNIVAKLSAQFNERFDRLEAIVLRTATLVEEQEHRNRIVLEGYASLWRRQDAIDARVDEMESTLKIQGRK